MEIQVASTEEQIRRCHPVLRQLRPRYDEDELVRQIGRQRSEGYRLAMLTDDGEVVAVAGFRLGRNLAWRSYLYVDDLVTDRTRRSRGYGRRLLDWLIGAAREAGCDELHLDSGVQRFAAHRFYLREGMDITSHHFRLELSGDR